MYISIYISLYLFMKCRRAGCRCRVPGRIKGEHSPILNRRHESTASRLQNKPSEPPLDRPTHPAAHGPPVQALLIAGRGEKKPHKSHRLMQNVSLTEIFPRYPSDGARQQPAHNSHRTGQATSPPSQPPSPLQAAAPSSPLLSRQLLILPVFDEKRLAGGN